MTKNIGTKSIYSNIRPAPYQLIPLTKLLTSNFNGILICDGVGVGKTISAGYIIVYLSKKFNKPSLVICNPTLIDKWILELSEKFDVNVLPIRSIDDLDTALNELPYFDGKEIRCYILSRSIFFKNLKNTFITKDKIFSCIVIDEIHNFRNNKTISYKNCFDFIKDTTNFRIGLSATPINNKIDDLFNELSLLFPKYPLESWEFTINDLLSQRKINVLSPIITRFIKEKLKIHFTKREIKTEYINLSADVLENINNQISNKIGKRKGTGYPLEVITFYRLANSSLYAFYKSIGKKRRIDETDEKFERLKEVLVMSNKKKWLIFCEFEETVKYLEDNLSSLNYTLFTLTGQTPMLDRKNIISMFENTKNGILILTSVGTEGLDLQFCSSLVNYDLNWNPMVLEQRIGRIDRIGQEKDRVLIYNFRIVNSIDDRIIRVLEKKLNIISEVFTIEEKSIISDDELNDEFLSNIINEELIKANEVIKGSNFTTILDYDDYNILSLIDLKYCNIEELTKIANTPFNHNWITKQQISSDWISDINKDQKYLKEILDYYS